MHDQIIFKHLINKGKREMVLSGGFIQFPIINTHPPCNSFPYSYELFLLFSMILVPFFRNTFHQTYPFTIRDGFDDVCIQQLRHLSLDNLHHVEVEPPFRQRLSFLVFFRMDPTGAYSKVNTLDVMNGPPKCLLVVP